MDLLSRWLKGLLAIIGKVCCEPTVSMVEGLLIGKDCTVMWFAKELFISIQPCKLHC